MRIKAGSSTAAPKFDQPKLGPKKGAQGSDPDDPSLSGSDSGGTDLRRPDAIRRSRLGC